MPFKPHGPCSYPGCPNLSIAHGRCSQHPRPVIRDPRPNAAQRGYGYQWQLIRDKHLKQHPYCAVCGLPGNNVDHILSKARGGTDDPANLQTLCQSHHSQKTAKTDGGYANRRKH